MAAARRMRAAVSPTPSVSSHRASPSNPSAAGRSRAGPRRASAWTRAGSRSGTSTTASPPTCVSRTASPRSIALRGASRATCSPHGPPSTIATATTAIAPAIQRLTSVLLRTRAVAVTLRSRHVTRENPLRFDCLGARVHGLPEGGQTVRVRKRFGFGAVSEPHTTSIHGKRWSRDSLLRVAHGPCESQEEPAFAPRAHAQAADLGLRAPEAARATPAPSRPLRALHFVRPHVGRRGFGSISALLSDRRFTPSRPLPGYTQRSLR